MKEVLKIVVGIFSFLPILSLALLVIKFYYIGDFFLTSGGFSPSSLKYMNFIFVGNIVLLMLMIFYVFHAVRDKRLTKDRKRLWIVLIFFLNINVLPFYWYMRIWKKETEVGLNN